MSAWQRVALGRIVDPVERPAPPVSGTEYRQTGVRLWGAGAYERETIDGSQTRYNRLYRTAAGDTIVNKIWARNGSVAVVSEDLDGCYASSEFPMFTPHRDKLGPRWFHWYTKTKELWRQCDEKSQGTSGKNRIRPEKFLEVAIPLPPLAEQQRIVARIDALAERIEAIRGLHDEVIADSRRMLLGAYDDLVTEARFLPMSDVAPIVRRPVAAEPEVEYSELGIRSFGNGTFHKSPKTGLELGSKRIFQIQPGDLLFSNVFAWEGAIAVVQPEDAGRVGSHRFISCVPKPGLATSEFLRFHFLTSSGLMQIGEASPGGAGRNRTLGLDKLERLLVPVPPYEKQLWLDDLQAKVNAVKRLQVETQTELDALLPSVLDRAFRGKL